MSYSISGLGLWGALGATPYADDTQFWVRVNSVPGITSTQWQERKNNNIFRNHNLQLLQWPTTAPMSATIKVKALSSMTAAQIQSEIRAVLRGVSGVTVTDVGPPRPIDFSSGGSGGGGGVTTSEACRARGGVCRDISARPLQANETAVRLLCPGGDNVVCVVPRARDGSTPSGPPQPARTGGGGGPSGGGGSRPAPPSSSDAAPTWGGATGQGPDWGTISLIGGAILLAGAVAFAVVKKRRSRAGSTMQPARAANRRRRRNAVDQGSPTKVTVMEGSTAWDVPRHSQYLVTDIQPDDVHGAKLTLSRISGRGVNRFVAYVRYRKHLNLAVFKARDAWGRGKITLGVTQRLPAWATGDLPLPAFESNCR